MLLRGRFCAAVSTSHVHALLNVTRGGPLVAGRASEEKKESVAALDEGDIALLKSFVRRTTMARLLCGHLHRPRRCQCAWPLSARVLTLSLMGRV